MKFLLFIVIFVMTFMYEKYFLPTLSLNFSIAFWRNWNYISLIALKISSFSSYRPTFLHNSKENWLRLSNHMILISILHYRFWKVFVHEPFCLNISIVSFSKSGETSFWGSRISYRSININSGQKNFIIIWRYRSPAEARSTWT